MVEYQRTEPIATTIKTKFQTNLQTIEIVHILKIKKIRKKLRTDKQALLLLLQPQTF